MTNYDVYLTLHIGAVVIWVGAGSLMTLLGTRALLAYAHDRTSQFARDSEWLGLRLYLPANAVVLATAFLLVEEGGWGYDPLWIQLAFAGFAVSFLTGALVFGPGWPRVVKLADRGSEIRRAAARLLVVSYFDTGLLLAVIFVMTAKPVADDQSALAVAAALPFAATLLGLAFARARAEAPEAGTAADAP